MLAEKQVTYKSYSLHNFRKIPQVQKYLSEETMFEMEVVGNVLPFKTNNYVVDELINWDNVPNDSMYVLTFPQKGMLLPHHYEKMATALKQELPRNEIKKIANEIRLELNPHPAGQKEHNVPEIDGEKLPGVQHKYRETLLFFPSQGQTCHAYCSFCFRWPQFVALDEMKFAMKEVDLLVKYLKAHPEVSDVLFTGGDPMIMKTKILKTYIEPLLEVDSVKTIRLGSKALSYWPYKFTTDDDSVATLQLLEKVVKAGKNLSFMAHVNHPVELSTPAVKEAVKNIRKTGAQIRTQSPILKNINDSADVWAEMWRTQVDMNMIPYYMFVVRDTGAQHYFGISLEESWNIFRNAYQKVSGVCRTVRGPSMSAGPGKVHILGVTEVNNEKVFMLRFIQGRNPDWVHKPFFAKYDENATWLDDLKPAFSEKEFFYSKELQEMYA
ncbi:MAG: lysine 2,3-aminomutase [Bacteroidia bacterium]|nr:lysine 2,3-aminomutase [Bacteroidia bacterium]